jgi:hypothetical protein
MATNGVQTRGLNLIASPRLSLCGLHWPLKYPHSIGVAVAAAREWLAVQDCSFFAVTL